jgi:hypothetical protein
MEAEVARLEKQLKGTEQYQYIRKTIKAPPLLFVFRILKIFQSG